METDPQQPLEWKTLSTHGLIAKLPAQVRARLLAAGPSLKDQGTIECRGVRQGHGQYRLRFRERGADGHLRARSIALGRDPAVAQGLESLLFQLRESDKLQQHAQRVIPKLQRAHTTSVRRAFMAAAPGGDHFRRRMWAEQAEAFRDMPEDLAIIAAQAAAQRLQSPRRGRPWHKRWSGGNLPLGKIAGLVSMLCKPSASAPSSTNISSP